MTKDYPANWRGRQAESLTYDGQVKSAPWVRPRVARSRPADAGDERLPSGRLSFTRRRWRNCRVGATHRPRGVSGGLHPPYKRLNMAREPRRRTLLTFP